MDRPKLLLGLLALAGVAMLVPALSSAGTGGGQNTVIVDAKLKGKDEVPGPGDPNGKGAAQIFLKASKGKVCFLLEIEKLDGAGAAHIHKGAPDVAGPIKVELFTADPELAGDGSYEGCVKKVKEKLVKRIGKNPQKFYVNVHNSEYPDGAIRGQLKG